MNRLILRSILFYWRPNLGVLAGTMLAAAVLTGALMVGDSVDYSLRTFALQRLGGIHHAMDTRSQFVDANLAERLQAETASPVAAALHLAGMAIFQSASGDTREQVNQVSVYGVDESFWDFGSGDQLNLEPYETALNGKLADALGVSEGDEVSLRVAKPSLMPRDSPLSWRDEERTRRGRYTVKHVLSDDEMGRFGLTPSQRAPYNAFVSREFLQQQVEIGHRVNQLLAGEIGEDGLANALSETWRPTDIGLSVRTHESGVAQIESDRIFLSDETVRAAMTIDGAEGVLTYLVNWLAKGDAVTPYFFVVAGPVPANMGDDEIVINRWVADELDAAIGDSVEMTYSELLASNAFENRTRTFRVHSIREMDELGTERALMPVFPGLSDVESCSEWDVGMPMDEELLNDEANERYWEEYRQTPKAFVTLAAGQEMFANRFGSLTSVRFAVGADRASEIETALRAEINPALAGLFFLPVREQALAAVSQAMDFGGLFLGMSFFLIGAALLLTGLLFVFNVQQRRTQIGTLMAVGYRTGQVRRLILGEGFGVALAGVFLGAGLGTLYTRALIFGLGQYWGGAVGNATILYHAKPATFVIGAVATLICAMLTMFLAVRKLTRKSARELHQGEAAEEFAPRTIKAPGRVGLIGSIAALAIALGLIAASLAMDSANVAPVFFGAGALLLASGVGLLHYLLRRLNSGMGLGPLTLRQLSLLDLARRPGRNLAVAALLASGCFLVFAVSSMQEDLTAHADRRSSGTGGFALVADSTFPLLDNPVAAMSDEVSGTVIKVRDGDDASCLNLNQAQTPRLLGVNIEALASRDAFTKAGEGEAFWSKLRGRTSSGAIPAFVGDSNTAMWTLKKGPGDVLIYQDEAGHEAPIELVAQLPMRLSVFQGSLVISQEHFTELFPSEDGYRMALIDAPASRVDEVAETLVRAYDRFGLDATPAVSRILEYYSVETTYLAMFLVLGGLGLAVGTVGMAVVILRNLVERRSETAMLEALGFRSQTVYNLAFTGYGLLVGVGLLVGGAAAFVAASPALFAADSAVDVVTQIRIATLVVASSVGFMALAIALGLRRVDFSALRNE